MGESAGIEVMPPSDIGGHFQGTITIPVEQAARLAVNGRVEVSAVLRGGDERRFTGVVQLIPPEGVSVISDIDDTIKVSHVHDRLALLDNTFCQPLRAVEGMAAAYRAWAESGAAFHYVSSSPYQLYEPLSQLLREAGFPEGELHMKRFRVHDRSALDLVASPHATKPPLIRSILDRFPMRRFVLVGDSAERDPEVYGLIAREHPSRVLAIYIRNVTGENPDDARYAAAFRDVAADRWHVFTDPAALVAPNQQLPFGE